MHISLAPAARGAGDDVKIDLGGSLESPVYVARMKRQWGDAPPATMTVVEFQGTGDRYFGGAADDRVLNVDGRIADSVSRDAAATFDSIDQAHAAVQRISNRRPGSILGVVPVWHH